ncbi:hypothetical protein [Paenibacillus ginsengarvi]|uniref:hypothetical protein n=1 Tax=Paenibacillus ginsengarvi TaxID=400777 RepID=UPI001F01B97C|nr:hypothetical protein [Paenibacillus ginsengarvi]
MAELGIEHIKAVTPQAKGRVERLWVTLQDRLVIEFRLLGITTLEAANAALPQLIQKHNAQFAVDPRSNDTAYMTLKDDTNLEHIFTIREYRTLGTGHTLSYGGITYTFVAPHTSQRFDAKTTVEVRETLTGSLFVWHHGQAFPLKKTERPARKQKQGKEASPASPRKPANDHLWKTTYDNVISIFLMRHLCI